MEIGIEYVATIRCTLIYTVYVQIEARASISFRSFWTWPQFEPSLYMDMYGTCRGLTLTHILVCMCVTFALIVHMYIL